jgi:toxin ParE1/3/4
LRDWLRPLSPRGLANVTAALGFKIRLLSENPTIGRPTPRDGGRETIEVKYGFLIPYWIKGEQLYILRVYRSNRKPLDYRTLITE